VVVLAVPNRDGQPIGLARNLSMASDGVQLIHESALDSHTTATGAPAARPPEAVAATSAVVASDGAEVQTDPVGGDRVTPAALAGLRRRPHHPEPVDGGRRIVYSSGRDGEQSALAETTSEAIDAVVNRLVDSWYRSATESDLTELRHSRPVVPPDIDRSLLQDLCARLDVYELSTGERFALRHAFWERIANL
jgi:hypothetical protein